MYILKSFLFFLSLFTVSGVKKNKFSKCVVLYAQFDIFFPSTLTYFSLLLAVVGGWDLMIVILVSCFKTKRVVVMIIVTEMNLINPSHEISLELNVQSNVPSTNEMNSHSSHTSILTLSIFMTYVLTSFSIKLLFKLILELRMKFW